MHSRFFYILVVVLLCIISCTTADERASALRTVAEADSLRATGVLYSDSGKISVSVSNLYYWRYLYPTEYAKANYYYGRLLRQSGPQQAAMQCFINGIHTFTHDHSLLGRIYTNIGSMCDLEGNDSIAYIMYKRACQNFAHCGDSVAVFYAMNDMAFALAKQGKIEEMLIFTDSICRHCSDSNVIIKTYETKAIAYKYTAQYDSVIHYVNKLQANGYTESTGYMIKAQVYSLKNMNDSAVYYAGIVHDMSHDLFYQNNSLYILTNNDEKKDKETILRYASSRSDIQKLIEVRQGELSHAVELLNLSLNRKSNIYYWILFSIVIICTIIIISVGLRIRNNRHKLIKETLLAEQTRKQIEQSTIENESILEQTQQLLEDKEKYRQDITDQIEYTCSVMRGSQDLEKELHWKNFDEMCDVVNSNFFLFANKMKSFGSLSEKEIRFCVLVLLNLSYKQMAEMLYYSESGMGKYKYSVSVKLGTSAKKLREFLIKIIVEGKNSQVLFYSKG